MLTSKQRAYLKGLAHEMNAILHIGKTGISPELTMAVEEALAARELIKIDVLNNCAVPIGEAAETISQRTRSELVQVIGKKIILYKKSRDPQKKSIEI